MTDAAPAAPLATAPDAFPAEGTAPPCPNCGAVRTDGDYCASCGQKNAPLRQPVHVFLQDAATEYFGLDGRLWRSLGLLLFHPGRLTRAYLGGRRMHYLRPVRLYLTATLLFFFLLSVLDPVGRVETAIASDDVAADSTVAVRDRLAALDAELGAMRAQEERQVLRADSLREALAAFERDGSGVVTGPAGEGVSGLAAMEEALADSEEALEDLHDRSTQRRHRRLAWQRNLLATWPPDSLVRVTTLDEAAEVLFPDPGPDIHVGLPDWMPTSGAVEQLREARTNEDIAAATSTLLRGALGQLPTVMFLLLPVFALLLKVIYLRRDWYYSEHLVFALHTHAFAFLAFALMAVLLGFSGGARWALVVSQLLAVVIPVYFYVAQKRVYAQGWIKTGAKALILGWIYFWLLVLLGLTLAFVLAALWG